MLSVYTNSSLLFVSDTKWLHPITRCWRTS